MPAHPQIVRAAVVQAPPFAFDRDRTLAKARTLAADAASQGAQLVVFPEAFVSAYPRGLDFGAVVGNRTPEGREQYRRYWESAVDIPGSAIANSFNCRSLGSRILMVPYCAHHRKVTTFCRPNGRLIVVNGCEYL